MYASLVLIQNCCFATAVLLGATIVSLLEASRNSETVSFLLLDIESFDSKVHKIETNGLFGRPYRIVDYLLLAGLV